MAQRRKGGAAPPGRAGAVSAVEAEGYAPVPPQGGPLPQAPAAPGAPAAPAAPRRTALAEGVDRLRRGARTEPGRLRLIGAGLALLLLAFGAASAWQTSSRAAAADHVLTGSQPLTTEAATIYRSLADADTTASTGFLSGHGQVPEDVRKSYDEDIARASKMLAEAAGRRGLSSSSSESLARLNSQLPVYTAQIQNAQTYNRQLVPLGGAWLRHASDLMQKTMLPEAERLWQAENDRLAHDYDTATPYPWLAIALGVLALAALGGAQYRDYRRTNRVLNRGLVAAGAAALVLLAWMVTGHTVALQHLTTSRASGVDSLTVLNEARIAALKARAGENLTLVNRGAKVRKIQQGDEQVEIDAYEYAYQQEAGLLDGARDAGGEKPRQNLLAEAARRADSPAGRSSVDRAREAARGWRTAHTSARKADDSGDYAKALGMVLGGDPEVPKPTSRLFQNVDDALAGAIATEQQDFRQAARTGVDAFTGITLAAGVLAVLGALGALLGVGRRLSEYR
ncbi:putative secreted protein [Streptomyces sp. Tu6071]|uniref:hypothetical protein n=1 Tax=Streptomyces sp. Tu6071 TaxID=355249 RepID=UPI00020E5E27|nr:hypothetical protein [Streptomyces sp. Tu6071]EGJ77345.1 putative secreted protein [Streptomyces sp. Tu6071]